MTAQWMGTHVEVLRKDGMWVTVRFLESCQYFKKGVVICITNCHITIERMPLICKPKTHAESVAKKFSNIVGDDEDEDEITTIEDLHDRLRRFVRWIVSKKASEHILMRRDEIEGELYLEIVKGWLYYKDNGLSSGQLLAVMRRILDNRISELVRRYYLTHRRDEHKISDYDGLYWEVDGRMSPQKIVEHHDAFAIFLDELSEDERSIVDILLHPDFRLAQQMALSSMRKSWVFKYAVIKVNPRIISEALHIEYKYARKLWYSIRRKWREYYDKI